MLMNYTKLLLTTTALLTLATGAMASETMRLPKGTATGESGPHGCPVFVADVKVEAVSKPLEQLSVTERGRKSTLKADGETKFRIPGVDAKQSGLGEVHAGDLAKIRYCKAGGKLLEVKVLREKSS